MSLQPGLATCIICGHLPGTQGLLLAQFQSDGCHCCWTKVDGNSASSAKGHFQVSELLGTLEGWKWPLNLCMELLTQIGYQYYLWYRSTMSFQHMKGSLCPAFLTRTRPHRQQLVPLTLCPGLYPALGEARFCSWTIRKQSFVLITQILTYTFGLFLS